MKFRRSRPELVWFTAAALLACAARAASAAPYRFYASPPFAWPVTARGAWAANQRVTKAALNAFLPQPIIRDFRFAQLGPGEICLIEAWQGRGAHQMEVVCPARGGGYWDTSLPYYAPVPLAWCVTELKGDGNSEVISSEGDGSPYSPPLYWYTIYSFKKGVPLDVSSAFPGFYRAVLLAQVSAADYLLKPPFAAEPLSPAARYLKMGLQFMVLKYKRRVLGQKKAGLRHGLAWIKSPYTDVQGLGFSTLADISDPRSIAALRRLGARTQNQGTCVAVVNALARLEGRAPRGIVGDPADVKKILKCDSMKPSAPCLLQQGCVVPAQRPY